MIATDDGLDAPPHGSLYAPDVAKRELVGIQEARDNFRERIDRAEEHGVHTVVARRGKPLVAVVPIEWYRRMCELSGEPTDL